MPIVADAAATTGPTLADMVTELVTTIQGYSVAPDRMTYLAGAIGSSDLSFVITGDAPAGVYEVDDELILVTAVDSATGTATVHPRGRGWLGSTPAAHAAGAVAADNPTLPRVRGRKLINDVITSLHPTLHGVGTTTITTSLDTPLVEMPADAEFILDVRLRDDTGTDWHRVRHWEAEMSSEAAITTGRAIRLPTLRDGRTVQVVYGTRPQPLASPGQFFSETGLDPDTVDLVMLGAQAKVAKALDLGRLTDRFVRPTGDQQSPQLGAGFAMARQLQADYQTELLKKATALRVRYPARSHFVR